MSDLIDTAQSGGLGQLITQDGQSPLESEPPSNHRPPRPDSQDSWSIDQNERQGSEETVKALEDHLQSQEESTPPPDLTNATATAPVPARQQQHQSSRRGSRDDSGMALLDSATKSSPESRRLELLRSGGTSGDVRSMGNVNTRTSQTGRAAASSVSDGSASPDSSVSRPHYATPSAINQATSSATPSSQSVSQVAGSSTQLQFPAQFQPAMTSRSVRLTKHAARKLLSQTACPTCSQALHEPITLPCGHTECLSCIYSRIGADLPFSSTDRENHYFDGTSKQSKLNPKPSSSRTGGSIPRLPCSTHVPPSLPLTPATVPCPDQTCPRSTVGRGLGLWAGHTARYTSSLADYPTEEQIDVQDAPSPGPGKPPVDGFVVGLPTHTKRLQVIGAQPRSQAQSVVSIPPFTNTSSASADQSVNAAEASGEALRTDVTLAKAMAILRRHAGQPTPAASPPRKAMAALRSSPGLPGAAEYMARRGAGGRGAGRNFFRRSSMSAYIRRSGGAGGGSRGLSSAAAGPSAERRRSLIALSSRREEDMESGTANGVRAVWDTDEDDEEANDDEYRDAEKYQRSRFGDEDEIMEYDEDRDSELDEFHPAAEFDWPADIGGAAARNEISPTRQHHSQEVQLPTASGIVSSDSGRRSTEARHSDLKRRRRTLNSNTTNVSNGGRSSQRGRTRIRQVSDVHRFAKRHENVVYGLAVGDDDWDTEDGSSIPGSEEGQDYERSRNFRNEETLSSETSAPLTRSLSSSSSDIDFKFHTREQQQQQQPRSQSHLDQMAASKLVDAGKLPLSLGNGIAVVQSPQASLAALHAELVDVLECQLCYLALYEPVTSPCGHTFCRTCLARSLDHSDRCPLCRSKLPNFAYFAGHPSNEALVKLLTSEITLPLEEEDPSHRHQPQFHSLYASRPRSNSTLSGFPFSSLVSDEGDERKLSTWGLKPLFLERKAAVEQEERENRLSTPIFVCTLAFPGMPTVLHVFEPRYRLMIRRCLESGNPRFGMVLPSRNMSGPTPGVSEYGTMLEIRSVQMLADGRSMIETVGSYRFKLLDKGALDGYTVGHVERYDDISLAEEAELEAAAMRSNSASNSSNPTPTTSASPSANGSSSATSNRGASSSTEPASPRMPGAAPSSLLNPSSSTTEAPEAEREQSTEELIAACISFIETIKSGSAPWLMTRLNSTYGPMPEPHEVEKFGYWIASVMPIDEHEKAKLLPIRSPRLRLRLVVHWIDQLRRSWWFNGGCTVS